MKHALLTLALIATASGCATQPPMTAEQLAMFEPPICESNEKCAVMWQKAQIWLVDNSAWRIQTSNDTLLQTFGPTDHSTDVAYTITKEPTGNGQYKIVMRALCANIYGCSPLSPRDSVIKFNNHLRGTK